MEITCGFIGLGLIGGSIAKALKQNRNDIVIYAYDKNPDTLRLASEEGIADLIFDRIDPAFKERIAAQNSFQSQIPTPKKTEPLYRFKRILRTSGIKPAARRKQRRGGAARLLLSQQPDPRRRKRLQKRGLSLHQHRRVPFPDRKGGGNRPYRDKGVFEST